MNSSQEESTATIFSSLVHAANDARACYASGSIADSIRMLQDIRRKAEKLERRLLTLTDDHSKNQFAGDLVSPRPQSHVSPPQAYPPPKQLYGEHRRSPTLPQPNQLFNSRTPPSGNPPPQTWTHAQESKNVSDYGGMSRSVGHRASPTDERQDAYQSRDTSEHQLQHRPHPHHHYHQDDREHRSVSYPSPYSANQALPQPARIHSPDGRTRIPMPPPTSPHPHSPGYGHAKHQGAQDHHPSESYPLQAARSALEALSGSEQTVYRQRRHASLPQVLDNRASGTVDSPSNTGSYPAFAMEGGGSPMQDVQYHRHPQPTSNNMYPHPAQHYQQHYPQTESPARNRHMSSRPSPTPRSPPIVHPHPYRVPSHTSQPPHPSSHSSHPTHPSYHPQHPQQPQQQALSQSQQQHTPYSSPYNHHNAQYHPSSHPIDENMRSSIRESSKVSTPRNNGNISTLLNNNTEGGYSPVATRAYDEGVHAQEWAIEAMEAVTTPLTPTTSAAQATVVQQQQQQQQQQAATRRKSSTSSKASSSGGVSTNGPGAPGGMVAMVVRGGNWVGRQRRVSESRSMTRVDNTGSRTQFHAPLEPEVVVKLDEIFFKFLQRLCSDLNACDSKGDHIHQPLMAKKMQRLEASTEFRPFKFRIQAFTNAFHDSLIEHGLTEDILPLRKIKVYLWKHRYISRFNEDGKKQKSKGNHVWNIEARKIFPTTTTSMPSTPNMVSGEMDIKTDLLPGAGGPTQTNANNPVRWEFREYTSRIAGQIIKFARVGIPYVYTPKIWDAQMSSPAAKFSSPWLPQWLRWHKGELKGVPTAEDRSCTITVVAEYLREGEECHLEMSFPLTVSDPSKEGELMDTPEDRRQGDVEEEEEDEEEEGDSELSKEEEEEEDEVESEGDETAANDDNDDYRDGGHSQGDEDEGEDYEMDENGDEVEGSDGAESSQSQRSQNHGRKRQGARSKQTKATKAAAVGRTKREVRGRGRGRGKRMAK